MSIVYRSDLSKPMTWEQLDDNFRTVESVAEETSRQAEAASEFSLEAKQASEASNQSAQDAERWSVVAQTEAGAFTSASEGLEKTVSGQLFGVLSSSSSNIVDVYQNLDGVAVDTGRKTISSKGVTESTPNLWPDPFFSEYFSVYGPVSSIPGRMSGIGSSLSINNALNPYGGASVDIYAGSGIRNIEIFVPFSEIGRFKEGDKITARAQVVTTGPVRFDLATRNVINGPAIQSTQDSKVGSGVVLELSASLTIGSSPALGLFLRVQLSDTNTGSAVVVAMIAGKGVGLGYSEKSTDVSTVKTLANTSVREYSVPVLGTDFFRVGKNLYDSSKRVDGKYININNFVLENTAYFYTDYMPVNPGNQYIANSVIRFILFYDKDKAFLGSSTSIEQQSQFIAPESAMFTRMSVVIAMNTGLQVEPGSTVTSYEPYGYYLREKDPHGVPIKLPASDLPESSKRPNSYGFEFLCETHQRLCSLELGDSARLNIGFQGDSWTHNTLRYVLPIFNMLKAKFGGLGDGWIGFAFASPGQTNGSVRGYNIAALAGTWTTAYATGSGPDAGSVTSSVAGSTASATLSTYTAERNIYLLALGGSGSITYKVGGANAVTVDLSTMTGVQKINMGLITGPATIVVTIASGSATLFGMIESLTGKGVGVHKLGSTGSRSAQWAALNPAIFRSCIAALELDLVGILLGTNDQPTATKAAFKSSIKIMIENVRESRPTADILLIAPCENQRGLPLPMSDYADAMYELAVEYEVAFLDLQPDFGRKPSDYAFGSLRPWFASDGIHPDPSTGGRAIAGAVIKPIYG